MNMKEAFPNLRFVGNRAGQFMQIELSVEQLRSLQSTKRCGRIAGLRLKNTLAERG